MKGGVLISKTQYNAYVRYREHYLRRITRDYGRKPLGTKGALLYMVCRPVVRPLEVFTQASECLGFFALLAFRTRVPLAPLCGYPNQRKFKGGRIMNQNNLERDRLRKKLANNEAELEQLMRDADRFLVK